MYQARKYIKIKDTILLSKVYSKEKTYKSKAPRQSIYTVINALTMTSTILWKHIHKVKNTGSLPGKVIRHLLKFVGVHLFIKEADCCLQEEGQ